MTDPQPSVTPLTDGVCAAWAQPSELPVDVQDLHPEGVWCSILGFASDILWAESGRRWRNVEATESVTLDPDLCVNTWLVTARWGYSIPLSWDDHRPHKVRLPRPDVTHISSVTLGGDVFTGYRLLGNWVIRTDRVGWPVDPSTVITYQYGRLIPLGANLAAIALGTELGKAFAGKACSLPSRVTSVTRQGITFTALESLEVLKEDLVGVHSVDLWLKTVNPNRTRQAAQVWSPDFVEARPR